MNEPQLVNRLEELLFLDHTRMRLLQCVSNLALPDCWVAAGFIRNLVWDHLHGYSPTPLNDVDVIYFDGSAIYQELLITQQLQEVAPEVNWEVKNQARMHLKHNDAPYKNCAEAMMHWPEKETAVGVALNKGMQLRICAPFGLTALFQGVVTHNPARPRTSFEHRVNRKGWLTTWPKLKLRYDENNGSEK